MDIFGLIGPASFYGFMAGILVLAVLTVTTRNLFHSAIFLAFTLIGVACIYFFLRAEFLGGVQILLYVGAIMTLVIFAIMLTAKMGDPSIPQSNRQRLPVFLALAALAFLLVPQIVKTSWKVVESLKTTSAVELGQALMSEFVLPFELISIVLLAALIGAIAIARSDQ
ncbi:MAG: NADH-quinone oxidoreductase subunit J [Candidatus Omnitrophica bacterium]|nr:NADH-quinone oxidoreductase subunit J [Candidatus Omnitrophota bacterium]